MAILSQFVNGGDGLQKCIMNVTHYLRFSVGKSLPPSPNPSDSSPTRTSSKKDSSPFLSSSLPRPFYLTNVNGIAGLEARAMMDGDGDDDVMMMAEQTNNTLTLRACGSEAMP
jgi:hypothetical protein